MIKKASFFLLFTLVGFIGFFAFSGFDTKEVVQTPESLGKLLFFDNLLSRNKTISCASCHKPQFAFSDTVAFSIGDNGKAGKRNAPSVMNQSERSVFFYDGRAGSLEEQVLHPIKDSLEMNLSIDELIERLNGNTFYKETFNKVFGQNPNAANLGKAIASYERTLETFHSPWDNYAKGDKKAVSESALRGRKIFNTNGKCFDCHNGTDFTNDEFRNIGLYNGKELNDRGRFDFTKDTNDIGKFKVPGLRNVLVTAPYMHNGMFKTLGEVIAYYSNPPLFVRESKGTDSLLLKPLNLSPQDMIDLEAFLMCLTDEQFLKKKN